MSMGVYGLNLQEKYTDGEEEEHGLLHYWFVQYNPLYFFSALCVLAGVYLMSRGLDSLGFRAGQLILVEVVQAYEILLIVGAGLLYRVAGQRRPAVILAMMEVLFLMDCNFLTEGLGAMGSVGAAGSTVWVTVLVVKVLALAWIFSVKLSLGGLLLPVLAGVGVAYAPHMLSLPSVDKDVFHLVMTWYGLGLVWLAHGAVRTLTSRSPLSDWGDTVFYRATRAACVVWSVFYFVHLAAWMVQFNISFTAAHVGSLLALAILFVPAESWSWIWGGLALGLGIVHPFPLFPAIAVIVAGTLAVQAWRLRSKRLCVGVVLALHAAVWLFGWKGGTLPYPPVWLSAVVGLLLLGMAWGMRTWTALVAACAVLAPCVVEYLPQTILEWGIVVTSIGFLALIAGVAVNWNLRHKIPPPPST